MCFIALLRNWTFHSISRYHKQLKNDLILSKYYIMSYRCKDSDRATEREGGRAGGGQLTPSPKQVGTPT